jgi:hypothetical protein
MISRASSTEVCEAASISITSTARPSATATHDAQTPQGRFAGSGSRQLTAFASRRAIVVLPTPRGPVKRYACATRSSTIALRSVCTTCSCPTSSSNVCDRHFL